MNLIPISRYIISGKSMLPTLKEGDSVICFNWAYLFLRPKIKDLVVVKIKDREIIKRITSIKQKKIFIEGDNRKESTDSRSFGWVSQSMIIGKVVGIIKQ